MVTCSLDYQIPGTIPWGTTASTAGSWSAAGFESRRQPADDQAEEAEEGAGGRVPLAPEIVVVPLQAGLLDGLRDVLRQRRLHHLALELLPVGAGAAELRVALVDLGELGAGDLLEARLGLVGQQGPPLVLALLEHGEEDVAEVVGPSGEVQHGRSSLPPIAVWRGAERPPRPAG